MNKIIKHECAVSLFGLGARAHNVVADDTSGRIRNQKIVTSKEFSEDGQKFRITARLRFDDECQNGHETFSITGDLDIFERGRIRDYSGGCIHEEIEKHFPELAHLIKWHLVSTDGPMHYLGNTLYLADDRDCHGLRKGEQRQIKNGRTGALCWELVAVNAPGVLVSGTPTGDKYREAETLPLFILDKNADGEKPPVAPRLEWRPWMQTGDGKERELDAARRSAVWPDATDEDLSQPRELLQAALEARLPALLESFKVDMLACGFVWPESKEA